MSFTPSSTVQQVLDDPAGRAILQRWAPELLESTYLADVTQVPLRAVVEPPPVFMETGILGIPDPVARKNLWADLAEIPESGTDTAPTTAAIAQTVDVDPSSVRLDAPPKPADAADAQ